MIKLSTTNDYNICQGLLHRAEGFPLNCFERRLTQTSFLFVVPFNQCLSSFDPPVVVLGWSVDGEYLIAVREGDEIAVSIQFWRLQLPFERMKEVLTPAFNMSISCDSNTEYDLRNLAVFFIQSRDAALIVSCIYDMPVANEMNHVISVSPTPGQGRNGRLDGFRFSYFTSDSNICNISELVTLGNNRYLLIVDMCNNIRFIEIEISTAQDTLKCKYEENNKESPIIQEKKLFDSRHSDSTGTKKKLKQKLNYSGSFSSWWNSLPPLEIKPFEGELKAGNVVDARVKSEGNIDIESLLVDLAEYMPEKKNRGLATCEDCFSRIEDYNARAVFGSELGFSDPDSENLSVINLCIAVRDLSNHILSYVLELDWRKGSIGIVRTFKKTASSTQELSTILDQLIQLQLWRGYETLTGSYTLDNLSFLNGKSLDVIPNPVFPIQLVSDSLYSRLIA